MAVECYVAGSRDKLVWSRKRANGSCVVLECICGVDELVDDELSLDRSPKNSPLKNGISNAVDGGIDGLFEQVHRQKQLFPFGPPVLAGLKVEQADLDEFWRGHVTEDRAWAEALGEGVTWFVWRKRSSDRSTSAISSGPEKMGCACNENPKESDEKFHRRIFQKVDLS